MLNLENNMYRCIDQRITGSGQDYEVIDYRSLKRKAYFYEFQCLAFSEDYFEVS